MHRPLGGIQCFKSLWPVPQVQRRPIVLSCASDPFIVSVYIVPFSLMYGAGRNVQLSHLV